MLACLVQLKTLQLDSCDSNKRLDPSGCGLSRQVVQGTNFNSPGTVHDCRTESAVLLNRSAKSFRNISALDTANTRIQAKYAESG